VNKDTCVSKRVLKKFLYLLDKGMELESCLQKFPGEIDKLREYAQIINSFKNLKNIQVDKDFENKSLKDIYARARIEEYKKSEKVSKKDMFFIKFRPAYFKPLIIFLGVFILMSFSFGGTLYASESSLPGETLYNLKQASENIHVAITPDRYRGGLYLKLLEIRLNEASSILNKENFTDANAEDKLLSDIDITYKKCIEKNNLSVEQDSHMQMRIRGVKEGFKNKCKNQKDNGNEKTQMGKKNQYGKD